MTHPGESPDRARIVRAVEELLSALGHAPSSDPELARTGQLVAEAWSSELLSGYAMDPRELLSEALPTTSAEVIALRDVETAAMCPHYLLPAPGVVHLAYAPAGRIVGFGALSRLVQCFGRRLTLQESLVENVANALCEHLGAAGAMCIAELRPTCLTVRGERESWAQAISVGTAGNMRAGQALHQSALTLLQKR